MPKTWDPPSYDLRDPAAADKDFCTMARIVNDQKLEIALLCQEVGQMRSHMGALERMNEQLRHNLSESIADRRKAG